MWIWIEPVRHTTREGACLTGRTAGTRPDCRWRLQVHLLPWVEAARQDRVTFDTVER
jgi:hypothetical protein